MNPPFLNNENPAVYAKAERIARTHDMYILTFVPFGDYGIVEFQYSPWDKTFITRDLLNADALLMAANFRKKYVSSINLNQYIPQELNARTQLRNAINYFLPPGMFARFTPPDTPYRLEICYDGKTFSTRDMERIPFTTPPVPLNQSNYQLSFNWR